ncbi:hypothetical protein B0T16DRAFT_386879 [Cercophora newfieldiana]|uniref:Uncharacterized protein n=1 Tax=Cercophora newfieldiana TaxID=92897 RepID=A0AA39YF92_9PEZI|nr:hypothetical protein B0T16DRAFT_386879 [Cercophora newfieldiana]
METISNVDELVEQEGEARTRMKIARLMELSGAPDLAQIVADSPVYPGFVPASEETTEGVLERIGAQWLLHKETVLRHLEWSNEAARSIAHISSLQRSHKSRLDDQRQFDLCMAYLRRQEKEKLRDWPLNDGAQLSQATETAVALVDDLLKEVYKSDPNSQLSPDSGFNAIRMLKSEGYPVYRLPEVDEAAATLTALYYRFRARFITSRRNLQKATAARSRLVARRKQRIEFGLGTSGRAILKLQRRILWAQARVKRAHIHFSKARHRMNGILANLRERRNQMERLELPPEILAARQDLNEANKRVFMNWHKSRRERLVAKICYNILVSPYPPGVNNYNLLLLHLSKHEEHDLAQVVADHCGNWNHRLPGGATLLCLLYHYRRKGNYVDYQKVLLQMIGRHDDDLLLKPRSIMAVRRERQFQIWAEKYAVSLNRGLISERQDLEAVHLDFIIQGLLDLGQGRGAASLFVASLREGLPIPVHTRERLLSRCLSSLDGTSARIVVDGFLANIRDYGYLLHNTSHKHARIASQDAGMIQDSRVRGDEFRRLLNIVWARPFHVGSPAGAHERGYGTPVPATGLEKSLLSHQVQYLATLSWLEWFVQHLRRVDAILQDTGAALSKPIRSAKELSKLSSRMAEEQHFLKEQTRINEETREVAWKRWLDGEVHSSIVAVRKLKREMISILFPESFWTSSELLDAPYKCVVVLFDKFQERHSTSYRVVSCVEQGRKAQREYRRTLIELLSIIAPIKGAQRHQKRQAAPNDELFAIGLAKLAGKVMRRRRKETLMEKIKAWVPRMW